MPPGGPSARNPGPARTLCGRHHFLGNSGESLIDDAQALVRVGFGDVHGGRHTNDVVVHAAFADEQAALARGFQHVVGKGGRGFLGLRVEHEFERLHHAHAAHVADDRVFLLQVEQAVVEIGADDVAVADEVVFLDEVDDGGGGDAGDGIAAEGGDGWTLVRVGDLRRGHGEADGKAVGQRLGGGEDVRLDLPVLDAEPAFAGAAPAGLNLVGDEVAAVLFDDGEGDLEVLLGWHNKAADSLDGLGDHAGDGTRGGGLRSEERRVGKEC